MYIINNIPEFVSAIKNPGVYGLVPKNFSILDRKPIENILSVSQNCLIYGDVKEKVEDYEYIRYNPSFDVGIIQSRFNLNSPIFTNSSVPLFTNSNNLNDITIDLLGQILGLHIPKPIFLCTRDHLKEINTV